MRGLLAGAIGSGAQALFSKATARWTPEPPQPEPASRGAVRYLSGAAWGGLYALCRESFRPSPALFGVGVGLASAQGRRDGLQSHLVYGLSTSAAYALFRDLGPMPLSAVPAMLALQAWAWFLRSPPAKLVQRSQPWQKRFFNGMLVQKAALA